MPRGSYKFHLTLAGVTDSETAIVWIAAVGVRPPGQSSHCFLRG